MILRDTLIEAIKTLEKPTSVESALQLFKIYHRQADAYFSGTLSPCLLKTMFDNCMILLKDKCSAYEYDALKLVKDFREEALVLLLKDTYDET